MINQSNTITLHIIHSLLPLPLPPSPSHSYPSPSLSLPLPSLSLPLPSLSPCFTYLCM